MMKNWKINTALFVCAAFIFRILFFNVFVAAPVKPQSADLLTKTNFSTVKKRKAEFSVAGHMASIAEVREEKYIHQRTFLDSTSSALIQLIYSPHAEQITTTLSKIFPSLQYFSHFDSHRYLTLQVLRT
jgi:hypothetical protein